MKTIVIYKSKYGSTEKYARWIADDLGCTLKSAKEVSPEDLISYDTIIYGGGLYAEVINGVSLITKNYDKLKNKNLIVFTTGVTPIDCRGYYDDLVIKKNFREEMKDKIKVYNFLGKMILDELTPVHRIALKNLKKIMSAKKNPSQMEKLLIDLCDLNSDLTDKGFIEPLVEYVKKIGG